MATSPEPESDEVIYTRQLLKGPPSADFTVKSELNKELLKKTTWQCKKQTTTRPSVNLASAGVSINDAINMIDTASRPAAAFTKKTYARTGVYAMAFKGKPGQIIPKAGAFAEAGVGQARAEFSVFEAEAKGPNACARAEANVIEAGAMARAELASASAKAGPLGVKVGLGVDTGVSVGATGLELKVLGTGISVGPKTSISFLGSEVSCSVM